MVNQALEKQTPPRVAVIAFHGVADQKPDRTAQTISDLLLGLTDSRGAPRYSNFRELKVRLPVRAVKIQRAEGTQSKTRISSKFKAIREKYLQFDARSNFLAELHKKDKGTSPAAERIKFAQQSEASIVQAERRTSSDTLAHQYMREQLSIYQPEEADRLYGSSDSVYETTQLVGTRFSEATREEKSGARPAENGASSSHGKGCEVHIYEMFWADLSRVSSHLWRVLIDFFQLLAYLCGMGGKSLEFARAALPYSQWWTWFAIARFGAEFALTQAVLVLNLFLVGLATFFFHSKSRLNGMTQ